MWLVALACAGCDTAEDYAWNLPAGYPLPTVPERNPMTAAKVELGRYLFYDVRLSGNGKQACASCHRPQYAFAEPRARAVGSTGESHRRNALALVNVAYHSTLMWAHPELRDIERQLLIPMFGDSPVELGIAGREAEVLARFREDATYQGLFAAAFRGARVLEFTHVVDALAGFVRSLVSFESPFDAYAYGGRQIDAGDNAGDGRTNARKNTFVQGFDMSAEERAELLAFLLALTDRSFLLRAAHQDPVVDGIAPAANFVQFGSSPGNL